MGEDLAARFDEAMSAMRSLALNALFTLQVDIRCGVIHMLNRTLQSPYLLHHPANSPDLSVLSLNADLLSFDDDLAKHLYPSEHSFIVGGLSTLIDALLVRNAPQIQGMNEYGCERMRLNILVLQQNLKAVEGDVSLHRSAQFFDLFTEGADAIVAQAKAEGRSKLDFSMEEMKALVELCYSQGLQSPEREIAVQARKGLSEHLLQLSECMWNT